MNSQHIPGHFLGVVYLFMGQIKSVAFGQTSSIVERSQVDLGAQAGPIVGMPRSGTSGQWSRTVTHNVPCPPLENVIWSSVGTPGRQNPIGLPGVCS